MGLFCWWCWAINNQSAHGSCLRILDLHLQKLKVRWFLFGFVCGLYFQNCKNHYRSVSQLLILKVIFPFLNNIVIGKNLKKTTYVYWIDNFKIKRIKKMASYFWSTVFLSLHWATPITLKKNRYNLVHTRCWRFCFCYTLHFMIEYNKKLPWITFRKRHITKMYFFQDIC